MPRLAFVHLPRTGGTAIQHRLESLVGPANIARVRLPPDFLAQLDAVRTAPIVIGHFFYPVVRLLGDVPAATVVREPVERSISVWEYLQWQRHHPDHKVIGERGIRTLSEFAEDAYLAGHVRDNQTRLLGVEYDVESIVVALEAGEMDLPEARRRAAQRESAPADEAMLKRAKERLSRMALVGITDELPAFVNMLEERVGGSAGPHLAPDNASPPAIVAHRPERYDEATRQRLAELNALDAELYSFARELWNARRPHDEERRPQAVHG